MTGQLIVNRRGPVLHLINDNPGTRNALSLAFCQGLISELADASADNTIAAVVISGADGYFCAGGDLNVLKTRAAMTMDQRIESINLLHSVIRAIQSCTKPVIAAIEGGAAGAGVSLALASDLIIAADDTYISVAYIKIGLTPDGGATAFLSELAPRQLVNELCMFGDRMPIQRLAELGAVNKIVAPGHSVDEAQKWGARLNELGGQAISVVKNLTALAQQNNTADQLDAEAHQMAAAQGRDEGIEGIAAFLEKRPADFESLRLKKQPKPSK